MQRVGDQLGREWKERDYKQQQEVDAQQQRVRTGEPVGSMSPSPARPGRGRCSASEGPPVPPPLAPADATNRDG